MNDQIQAILKERENTYGDFTENARITQQLLTILTTGSNWYAWRPTQKHATYMILGWSPSIPV